MWRPWREEYKGGLYHVISRGNNEECIFKKSIDKGYFIKQIKETVEVYASKMVAQMFYLKMQK